MTTRYGGWLSQVNTHFPEFVGVPEQVPAHHVVRDGVVAVVPQPRRPALDALDLVVEEWLPGKGNDQEAVDLELGQLVKHHAVLAHSPGLEAAGEVDDGPAVANGEQRLQQHLELRQPESRGYAREDVAILEVAHPPPLDQLVGRPEGGCRTAAGYDQGGPATEPGASEEQTLLPHGRIGPMLRRLGDGSVGQRAADENESPRRARHSRGGPDPDAEQPAEVTAQLTRSVTLHGRGERSHHHRNAGTSAGGSGRERSCRRRSDDGVGSAAADSLV